MDGRLWWNPIYARIFFKYLLAKAINFKSERYDESRVRTLRTRRISNILSPLPLKISAFQCAVYAVNVSITNLFPPESRENRFNINYSNTIWRVASSPHNSPITAPVWFSSTHNLTWFSDVGYSVRPVRGAAYDDAQSSWVLSLGTVRRSATAPDLINANIEYIFLMCERYKTDYQKVAVMWSRFLTRHVL